MENLRRHVDNLRTHFGFPCVVALNRFNSAPPPGELALVTAAAEKYGIQIVPATHWADGGQGAVPLAEAVVDAIENSPCNFRYLYPDEMPLWEKIRTIATKIYGAGSVTGDATIKRQIAKLEAQGFGNLPVCIAKTQFSFSTDASAVGLADGHTLHVREVRLSAGCRLRGGHLR